MMMSLRLLWLGPASGFQHASIPLQRKFKAAYIMEKGEASSRRASFIGDIFRNPQPTSPTMMPFGTYI
jgi:hypothetical protein